MKNTEGFTLIELLVTVAVLGIVLTVGVPGMSAFIKNSRITTQTNGMIASFHLARTEAIKRGLQVTLCKSSNQSSCDTTAGNNWDIGWILFLDNDENGAVDPTDGNGTLDTGETILQIYDAVLTGMTVAPKSGDTDIEDFISYSARGELSQISGGRSVLRVCDDRGNDHARGIVLSPTGRVEVTTDTSSSNIGSCP